MQKLKPNDIINIDNKKDCHWLMWVKRVYPYDPAKLAPTLKGPSIHMKRNKNGKEIFNPGYIATLYLNGLNCKITILQKNAKATDWNKLIFMRKTGIL